MNDSAESVHVVFSPSAAGTLRKALRRLGKTDRVIGLPDSLSVGPIDPPDQILRQSWGRSVLRTDSILPNRFDGDPLEVERTWAEATAPEARPVFWTCLSSPMEHSCFLAFAARMEGRSFDVIAGRRHQRAATLVGGLASRPCFLPQRRTVDREARNPIDRRCPQKQRTRLIFVAQPEGILRLRRQAPGDREERPRIIIRPQEERGVVTRD